MCPGAVCRIIPGHSVIMAMWRSVPSIAPGFVTDRNPHARAWAADRSLNIDVPWGGLPYRPRPFGYYGDVAICSVDSTRFCYQDSSMWHADFHFNEVSAAGLCMQRQFDALDSYFVMIRALLPMAQANARQVY